MLFWGVELFLTVIYRPLKKIALLDSITWLFVLPLALYIRLVDAIVLWTYSQIYFLGLVASIAQIVIGTLSGLYRGRYRFGSFDEMKGLMLVVVLVGLVPFIPPFIDNSIAPRSFGILSSGFALAFMYAYRFIFRIYREKKSRSQIGLPTLIYGAGDTGAQIVQQIDLSGESIYKPVGFIDDDSSKQLLRLSGLRVLGTQSDLKSIIVSYDVKYLVLAMTNVNSEVLANIHKICSELNVAVSRVPSSSELISGKIFLKDLESITEEDLIGRRRIFPDDHAISKLIAGKRILVTGAGGSIGSEISRQVHRYAPSEVYMLDRDESLLHALQLTLDGRGLLDSENLILADIRDRENLKKIFTKISPQVIFHAAALKHLTLLERYPDEAVKTNIEGTRNVLIAASECEVEVFINISTDKAVNPTSVLGESKKRAEELVTEFAKLCFDESRWLSVRFGNVLGSRGSVIEAFKYQIQRGGPVVVTDPKVERFFMTIPEAVHLVLEASAKGKNSDVLVLDMGTQVKVLDIAKKMIERSGKNIEIRFSGLRVGEKLKEELSQDKTIEPISQGSPVFRVK